MPRSPLDAGHSLPWSHAAIASAVFSIVGLLTLWLGIGLCFAAVGAVCGHLARTATRHGQVRGGRLATLGIGVGYGAMLMFPIVAAVIAMSPAAWEHWKEREAATLSERSRSQAARLFAACENYARANGDRYPERWEELSGRYLPDNELRQLLSSPHREGAAVAYELVRHDRPVLEAIAESVVVIQEIAPPRVPEIAVVFADGSVRSIHNPAYDPP